MESRGKADWEIKPLKELVTYKKGKKPAVLSDQPFDGGIPYLDIKAIEQGITDRYAAISSSNIIEDGSLLVVWDGARSGWVGKSKQGAIGSTLMALTPKNVDHTYLYHFLKTQFDTINSNPKGTGIPHVDPYIFWNIEVPIAPPEEQKKIAEFLTEVTQKVDNCRSRLDRIPLLLKRFRQSVLAAAVSGELTKGWREENKNIENADQILQRIEKEKAKFVKEKKVIQKQSDFELVQLPEKWKWGAWEDYLDYSDSPFRRGPFGSSLKKEIFISSGYKIYEQYCPINDDCSFSRYFIDEKKFKELKNFAVKAGDFLISCSGVTLGRITRVPEKYDEGIINQALLRVRINNNFFDSNFFLLLFRSPYFQKSIFENSTGSAIPNVKGVNELKAIPAPLLSLEEQNEIVRIVNALFFISDNIESRYNHLKRYTDSLPQAILRGVFGRGGIEK